MSPKSNQNNFFGVKVSKPGINVNNASDSQLIYKSDYSTDTWYGDYYKSLEIGQIGTASSLAYGMNVYNSKGDVSLTLGQLSNGDYGMDVFNGSGGLSLTLGQISSGYGMDVFNGSGGIATTLGELGSSSYGMSVPASNGTIYFGLLSDGNLGIQVQDTTGYILFEMTGQTWFWYDKTTSTNVMQVGLLPDGTYGMAVAKPGQNV